jgi:hypothetical protein
VTLVPGYPRAGEEVTIQVTVRNLGGRPSPAATMLSVAEGEPDARIQVGSLPVPILEPGAFVTLSLPWAPAAPPGPRPLSLVLDPEELVTEQDEGNNEVLRTVVVQDADLYLTEPVFSPDGDGVKDQTTLAWRATGRVRVVVSNSRGQAVRTLVEDGPESGSATWDGRDQRGVMAWDGSYAVSVIDEAGQDLGAAPVQLDTNRSPIHDAAPGRTTIRNLTCQLPTTCRVAWMPGEDEVLYIDAARVPGRPPARRPERRPLLVAQDEWYRSAVFAAPASVSPDGREVLVRGPGAQLFLVDLASGERRPLGSTSSYDPSWSPDGRFIRVANTILERDGSLFAYLNWGEWVWSPGSDRLAQLEYSMTTRPRRPRSAWSRGTGAGSIRSRFRGPKAGPRIGSISTASCGAETARSSRVLQRARSARGRSARPTVNPSRSSSIPTRA